MMADSLTDRAARHAALGEPTRLAIVDDLVVSDRSPTDLAALVELPGNLLAHHLDVLERAGIIERFRSAGDQRRRYVRLVHSSLQDLGPTHGPTTQPILFVCTHNSARSQLAAALWTDLRGTAASSAGTEPADRVHPGAVAAGRRRGLDLSEATPRLLSEVDHNVFVITVCDRANEQLGESTTRWHWSIPDPVTISGDAAFDAVLDHLDSRIRTLN